MLRIMVNYISVIMSEFKSKLSLSNDEHNLVLRYKIKCRIKFYIINREKIYKQNIHFISYLPCNVMQGMEIFEIANNFSYS